MEEKKYKVIYADPPWRYRQKGLQGAAEHHYSTMSIEELCQLPVNDLADKDSVLFMWATFPQLQEALRLIKAWGFVYKTVAFVWLKKNKVADSWFYGLGFWTRGNAEICLLATKGKPKRESAGIHQFIISPIEQHSKKPDIARDKIVQLMGDVPRIELFARQVPDGWDVWGNEVPCDILMEGSENNGVCAGSEGLDESQNQGDVQPDKETADLLLSGSGSGTALLPAY
jgi:N6-adenosine-specific RNA methylase IME4